MEFKSFSDVILDRGDMIMDKIGKLPIEEEIILYKEGPIGLAIYQLEQLKYDKINL